MDSEDVAIGMMLMNAYADWGGGGMLLAIVAIVTLWMGQAWLSVDYE